MKENDTGVRSRNIFSLVGAAVSGDREGVESGSPLTAAPTGRNQPTGAFTLLEMMLAIAIFSITVVGMVTGMNQTIRSSSMVAMSAYVRQQLDSRLLEARLRLRSEGTTTSPADGRGVIYTTVAEPLKLRDSKGHELQSLYRLQLTAKWVGPEGPQSATVEEYVFKDPTTAR